jgi:filamentous hemagglutinin
MNALTRRRFLTLVQKPVACLLGFQLFLAPALSLAGSQIPGFYGNPGRSAPSAGTLPSAQQLSGSGFAIALPGTNQLVVNQSSSNVVIDWNSFDIGSAASVVFNQKNSAGVAQPSWTALNRIHDANPSQIFGSLKADGNVYLLNQNGILFGSGSVVNVGGLIASTLNLRGDDATWKGLLKFRSEDLDGNPLGDSAQNTAVSNFGSITTSEGGAVYLLAPVVENGGSIVAPYGNVGLIAAVPFTAANPRPAGQSDVQSKLDYDVKVDTTGVSSTVTFHKYLTGGSASNFATGQIVTDAGKTGMYGGIVNQDGLIRATTVVKKNGIIELLADKTVSTGAASVTSVPISDSADTVDATFSFTPGSVTLGALQRDATIENGDIGTTQTPPSLVNHRGLINAPGGLVNLVAQNQVFLDSGSIINVSGVWSDSQASAGLVNATLNSINLRDNTSQKDGTLQGATVTVNQSAGSSIGDIQNSLGSAPLTAQQLAQNGGSIILGFNLPGDAHIANVTDQIIVKPGAELDFQGGGIRYLDGYLNTTKLLNGTTVWNIASAPANLSYDQILGAQTVNYARFGVSQTYNGIYLGGNSVINNLCSSYLQGSDAGQLSLRAGQVVLNGTLNGNYAKGLLQTKYKDSYNTYGELNGVGLIEPAGGRLTVGDNSKIVSLDLIQYSDMVANNVIVTPSVQPLNASFSAGDALPAYYQGKTLLSAEILNKAGLSTLALYSNDSITIEKGAALSLNPFIQTVKDTTTGLFTTTSAGFSMTARSIQDYGSLTVPAGYVNLKTADNLTSNVNGSTTAYYRDSRDGILLADGSSISVGGERFDSALPAQAGLVAHTGGGSISLKDTTYLGGTVTVEKGSSLDLSGGYQITPGGSVSGGNAGSLSISALSLVLDGDLDGTALAGKDGGKLSITTEAVTVSQGSVAPSSGVTLPPGMDSRVPMSSFNLSDTRFSSTGFSQLSLTSYDDLRVVSGTVLEPSGRRYQITGAGSGPATLNYLEVSPQLAGNSSLTLTAGAARSLFGIDVTNYDSRLVLDPGAALQTMPGGSLTLSGPGLEISGRLQAPGGTITLSSTRGDVNLNPFALILAQGYNMIDPSSAIGNTVNTTPRPGGTVSISSHNDLNLKLGALIDVSGAPAVETLLPGSLSTVDLLAQAGQPGTVNLSYFNTLNLAGGIQAHGYGSGLTGGTLSISSSDPNSTRNLALTGKDVAAYLGDGFDALSFASLKGIALTDIGTLTVPRSLTLDAPAVVAGSSETMVLNSPWIQVKNSSYPTSLPAASGAADLTLKGDWVDFTGDLRISGFRDLTVEATRDIRLTDVGYLAQVTSPALTSGRLELSGDLTLKAARIYPTSQSSFIIQSDNGSITVLPGASFNPQDPVYSALGTLKLVAATGIDQRGVLLAPLGNISLSSPDGRVLLADGSVTSVAGSANVAIGSLDDNFNWITTARSGVKTNFTGLPAKGISISGKETVLQAGSLVDLSGGGSVFTYQFVPGIQGSFDPVATSGAGRADRYVIVPGSSYDAPGKSIYLQAGNALNLKAGNYTVLDESYAFVPGALVVSRVGAAPVGGSTAVTTEG